MEYLSTPTEFTDANGNVYLVAGFSDYGDFMEITEIDAEDNYRRRYTIKEVYELRDMRKIISRDKRKQDEADWETQRLDRANAESLRIRQEINDRNARMKSYQDGAIF